METQNNPEIEKPRQAKRKKIELTLEEGAQIEKRHEETPSRGEMAVPEISKEYAAEVAAKDEARLEEMCSFIDAEFKKTSAAALLPFGIVLTGGGSKLPGMVDLVKRALRLPASMGLPNGITSGIDRVQDPVFSTALGLVAWGKEMALHGNKKSSFDVANVGGAFKRMFKSLMP